MTTKEMIELLKKYDKTGKKKVCVCFRRRTENGDEVVDRILSEEDCMIELDQITFNLIWGEYTCITL